ncbi:carbohydrate ABC transporter permease [Halobacterium jilantaiense]|uniref:Glucose/mannose transport system permease protein n=1 Tax=Halobacterium jilantaiense TaxID=355548 RepID=A0A1I0MMV7_9EURY|nr:sugar ABC transporter permease [Halobacterium jilantaiense]SEV89802.1 glucose/mannose transport system permease protein [Halobacterium jilantaiense]
MGSRIFRLFRADGERDPDAEDGAVRTDGGTATSDGAESTGARSRVGRLLETEFAQSLPFWLPATLLVGLFVYGAIGWNFLISLTDWSGLRTPTYESFDFEMYTRFFEAVARGGLFSGPQEYWALRNTFVLLVVFTVAALAVGLLLAILVDRDIRFENTFRTIYLLPMSLSFVVTAIFWAWMYNPTTGLINEGLRLFGLGSLTQQWISDPQLKLFAVMFALVWQFSGYAMVVYLAGLRAIPTEQYEAAKVDGAGLVKMYWRTIIPQLRASTTSAAVVLMVFALKAFDFLYVMFGTRPGPSADILAMMMYRESFGTTNWAYGSAIAMILFALALGVIAPYLYLQFKRGEL